MRIRRALVALCLLMTSITGRNKLWQNGIAILFWILVWQIAADAVNRSVLIPIPSPRTTAAALLRLTAQPNFWQTVLASLGRICAGFLGAFILGTVCALLSSRYVFVYILTRPLIQLIRSIPVASFTILVFLWISRDRIPTVISFFTVLPIVWASVENGLQTVDRELCEMAKVFGLSSGKILTHIILPGLQPFFATAAANGLGFAWKSGVAAEVICRTSNSMGNLLWAGKNAIEYEEVFAVTLVVICLSTVLQGVASALLRGHGAKKTGQESPLSIKESRR